MASTGRYQVLDSLDSILTEALRQSRPECGHALGHAVRAEMLVEVRQLGVCVRRVLRSETVFHGAMDSDRGLELAPQNCEMCHCAILPLSAISGLTTLSFGNVSPVGLLGWLLHPSQRVFDP